MDTVASSCKNDNDYNIKMSLELKHDYTLILKSKNWYDEKTHTQFSPSIFMNWEKWIIFCRKQISQNFVSILLLIKKLLLIIKLKCFCMNAVTEYINL